MSLQPWDSADLPEPLPFTWRNTLRTIGPGAILLVGAIGMGEWIAGPLMVVKHGSGILWIATLAFVLQSILNLEAVRYTLATGEPILTGFMRKWPGAKVWGGFYILCALVQLGIPAAAAGCAGVIFAMFAGHSPAGGDTTMVTWISVGVVVLSALTLMSGRRVERVMERLSWAMIIFIFTFLLIVNVIFVPGERWGETFSGFLRFGWLPEDLDLPLLATFAALAGSGGVGNLAIGSWYRDKGFGMGQKVGGIGGALFEPDAKLDPAGKMFPVNEANLSRWKRWWKYALIDQAVLWQGGCLIGMFLMANLAATLFNPGMEVKGEAAGVFQAERMGQVWAGFWFLGLLNGFWILGSTQLANTDVLARTITDILWAGNEKVRRWPAGKIYGALLVFFMLFGCAATWLGTAATLLTILGISACAITAIAALQILWVNLTLLPAAIRPPVWRCLGLIACAAFYGFITLALIFKP